MSRSTLLRVGAGRAVSAAAPFVIPFVLLLIVTAPRGLSSHVSGYSLPITDTAEQARVVFGQSDAGSLLTAALSWADIHAITPGLDWVFNFWPPGMVVVDIFLIGVEHVVGIPTVLGMVLLNCAVWAVFFGVTFRTVRRIRGLLPAVIFAVGAFLSSAVTSWGTTSGLFFSDSFGAISFCFSILFVVRAGIAPTRAHRIRDAVIAGVFLGGASYFRASYEVVSLLAVIACAGVVALALVARFAGRLPRFREFAGASAVPVGITAAAAELFILPWRIYAGLRLHPFDFRWSAVSDLTSAARWIPDRLLLQEGAGFAAAGHSNWACIDDRVECARIEGLEESTSAPYSAGPDGYYTGPQFDHLTFESFLQHPWNYLSERFRALVIGFASNDGQGVKDFAIPESIVLVALLIAVIVIIIRSGAFLRPASLYFLGANAVQFATLVLLHQEPRYYVGIELGIMVMAAVVVGVRRPPVALERPPAASEIVGFLGTAATPRNRRKPVAADHGEDPEENDPERGKTGPHQPREKAR